MKHTFYLKEASSKNKTLIYFSAYFKKERKKFVYSTGEKILPQSWDKKNNRPFLKGENKPRDSTLIISQLNRYSDKFNTLRESLGIIGEDFNTVILKKEFDKKFKREVTSETYFFDTFQMLIDHKKQTKAWSEATVKKYNTLKSTLQEFEITEKYRLTFSTINTQFL